MSNSEPIAKTLQPAKILVINVSRIGDTLAATPAIDRLHSRWPEAEITVVGGRRRIEVMENLAGIAKVRSASKWSAPLRGRLGRKPYDLALVYHYDEPLVRYALRIARRVVAFRQKNPDINRRLFVCVEPDAYPTVHFTEHFLRLPAALGLTGNDGRIRYRCRPEETAAAEARLQSLGFAEKRPLIGLQIASFPTKSYRDWPEDAFVALARRILARWPDAGFLIYGGPQEKPRTLRLAAQMGAHAAHLGGELTLRQTAALMSLTDLYVGVDTGPTHLMSSFDIPIIGLYHPRHPASVYGPKDHPLNFSIDHPHRDDLGGEPRPMGDISVQSVFEQVEKALGARGYH
ncbi:MAG: glycosyltransferase family 9 protein [Betaproteobacteria bacterium]|nr:glycosyltransferase family 9 protein [Betaproteobacteria bacterium]